MTYKGIGEYRAITLTSGADQADTTGSSKNGGLITSDFKFTSANEKVTAVAGTLNATDVLADGSTTDSDVLDATLTSPFTIAASITNIETINANVKTAAGGLDLVSVSGAKAVNVNTNVGIAAALDNVDATAAPVIGLSGSGVLTVTAQTLAGTTAGGNAESLSVKLDGANTSGTGAATQRAGITLDTLVAGALETLNLESAGDAKNTLVLALDTTPPVPTGITKTVVTGAADLDLLVAHSLITGQTLNAADHEGALNLIVDRNTFTTASTNLTNVSGVDTYTFRDSLAGGDALVASGLVDGANVVLTYGTTGASSLAVRGAAAGSSDSLTLTLDHATASTDVAVATRLTIDDVETVNLISEGGTTTGNSIAALTVKSGSTVTVDGSTKLSLELAVTSTVSAVEIKGSGNHAFDFAGGAAYADGKNLTIDGYAATGKLSIDGRDFTGDGVGTGKEVLTITGGSGDDTIIATADGNATNVIDAGAGKDTVQVLGAAAKTTVTLGDGVDTLSLAAAPRNCTVTDFALGSGGDKLSVDTAAAVAFGGVGAAAVDNQLIVLNAAKANDAAVQAILDAATAEVAVLAINDATGVAELWYSATGTTADSFKLASFDNITTVGMLTDTTSGFVADNFGTWG